MGAKRALRMRSDIVIAKEAAGGMFVKLFPEKGALHSDGCSVFSGMRMEILNISDAAWLKVRCQKGDGWVRRPDVVGLGECSLDWAGEEDIISSSVLDQRLQPLQSDDYAMRNMVPRPPRSERDGR